MYIHTYILSTLYFLCKVYFSLLEKDEGERMEREDEG
jgi:hypothetical protein